MTQDIDYAVPFDASQIHEISLDMIKPDDNQVRTEFNEDDLKALAESIKSDGQIQPILVTMSKEEDKHYIIVDGERRWRACKMLVEQHKDNDELAKKFSIINAVYVKEDAQLVSILGNIIRNDYNSMETADAYSRLKKLLGKKGKDATNKEVGDKVGKAPNSVSEYLSLHDLPEDIKGKAKKDSRVPYNKLLEIVRGKGSDDDKRKRYDNFYKIYSSKENFKAVKQDSKQGKATKRVVLFNRKIMAVNQALEKKTLKNMEFDGVDDSEKAKLKKSLLTMKETADYFLAKLEAKKN